MTTNAHLRPKGGCRPTPTKSVDKYNVICPDCQARYWLGERGGWIDVERCKNCAMKGGRYIHLDEDAQYRKRKAELTSYRG